MATQNSHNNMVAGVGISTLNDTASTIISNKGDLLVGNGVNSATVLAVGTNTHLLLVDSAQSVGMKYDATQPPVVQISRSFGYGNSLTNYTFPVNLSGVNAASGTMVANTLYCHPFSITKSTTFSLIGMKIGTTSATTIRLGIYDATGTGGYPGSRVLDAGVISGVGTGEITIGISQLLSGNYWLVFISSGAARPTLAVATQTADNVIGLSGTTQATMMYGIKEAAVAAYFAALPASLSLDTFTLSASATDGFCIFLKV